jgi:hypothetical protein
VIVRFWKGERIPFFASLVNRRAAMSEGSPANTDLLKGLQNRSPKDGDASMKCKGGSVNSEATREGTAKTPGTLGPRTA